jgi:hypothetical protein
VLLPNQLDHAVEMDLTEMASAPALFAESAIALAMADAINIKSTIASLQDEEPGRAAALAAFYKKCEEPSPRGVRLLL